MRRSRGRLSINAVGVLLNIRSLHNAGSIFRTADGAGFSKLYLCGITPAPLDHFGRLRPEFAKVALGAERSLAWEHHRSAVRVIKKLKKEGWKVYAVEQAQGSMPYFRIPKSYILNSKFCLVVGNEVEGLPKRVLALADKILEIPMYGAKESLNVSVAFGIAAYHIATASR